MSTVCRGNTTIRGVDGKGSVPALEYGAALLFRSPGRVRGVWGKCLRCELRLVFSMTVIMMNEHLFSLNTDSFLRSL